MSGVIYDFERRTFTPVLLKSRGEGRLADGRVTVQACGVIVGTIAAPPRVVDSRDNATFESTSQVTVRG